MPLRKIARGYSVRDFNRSEEQAIWSPAVSNRAMSFGTLLRHLAAGDCGIGSRAGLAAGHHSSQRLLPRLTTRKCLRCLITITITITITTTTTAAQAFPDRNNTRLNS